MEVEWNILKSHMNVEGVEFEDYDNVDDNVAVCVGEGGGGRGVRQ